MEGLLLGASERGRIPVQVRELDLSGDAVGGRVVLVSFTLSNLALKESALKVPLTISLANLNLFWLNFFS